MEIEIIIRILAICAAVLLLVSNLNILNIFNKITSMLPKWKKNNQIIIDETPKESEKPFLEIVDLWYDLKEKCLQQKLDKAVEKLDEVFPLFNVAEE